MTRIFSWQTSVNLCPASNSYTVQKVVGPKTDFPTWGLAKKMKTTDNLSFEASGIGLQTSHKIGETDSLGAQTKLCVHHDLGERRSYPT